MDELERRDHDVAVLRGVVDGLLDQLVAAERAAAGVAALRSALLEQLRTTSEALLIAEERALADPPAGELPRSPLRPSREIAERSLRAEVACALRIPERTAEARLAVSRSLLRDLPETFTALSDGRIMERQARTIVECLPLVPAERRAEVERRAIAEASRLSGARFERRMRELCAAAEEGSLVERRRRAERRRGVWVTPERDGMALLEALLPAPTALAIRDRLSAMAIAVARASGEGGDRTRDELRADVLGDLLLDGEIPRGPAAARGIRPQLAVAVPVLTLLGSEEPAQLEGYGPIDAETARELAAQAPGFTRLLTHPETGIVLSVGRERYRPPEELRRWIRLRDGTCRFPGCRVPARFAELDHTDDWAARKGATAHDNLAVLCAGHHTLKHASAWSVRQERGSPGSLRWRSPAGREYRTEPALASAPGNGSGSGPASMPASALAPRPRQSQ